MSGHADESTTTGRARQRRLDRLATRLVEGAPEADLVAAAERADWEPPGRLTAVALPESKVRSIRSQLDARTLYLAEDAAALDLSSGLVLLLVPTAGARDRQALLRVLADAHASVGPERSWTQVRSSYRRVVQANRLGLPADTDQHLAAVVVSADQDALADLRARVLAPLAAVGTASRTKLTETLRAWLLHQGRRDEVAASLFVHPQTVRYRVGQLRDLYGERLTDPEFVRDAVIALS